MHASFTWNQVQQPATIFKFSHANYENKKSEEQKLVCSFLDETAEK